VLDNRTLNRTLLERQGLLRRERRPVRELIGHLVGMQSQVPNDPFVALWSRIADFDPAELDALMLERRAVRTGVMRTTLHLLTAEDAIAFAPLFAGVQERAFRAQRHFREAVEGLDLDALIAAGTAAIEEAPRTPAALARILAERWPGRDPQALSLAVRYFVPIVQVTPRGMWGRKMQPTITTVSAWLGTPVPASVDPAVEEEVVLRYLRAFGPASVSDVRTWSWLTGLRAVVDRVRPRLRVFADERGRELLDAPDAPIADPDVEAPVRYLPEYDNLLLSHDDRSRMAGSWYPESRYSRGSVLVDGRSAAGWHVERAKGSATLMVDVFDELAPPDRAAVEAEGAALLEFIASDATTREVVLARYDPTRPPPAAGAR
jgi:hypothetical protein